MKFMGSYSRAVTRTFCGGFGRGGIGAEGGGMWGGGVHGHAPCPENFGKFDFEMACFGAF